MSTPPNPTAGAKTEFDLLGALFSPAGRADPQVILRGSALPGCQYLFVRDVLRDPRFAAPAIPPSQDPTFQLLRRWMIRLDGDRHRRVRDAFGGLFTARRVERYRAIIAGRAAALIDQVAPAGSMDLVADFARPLPFAVISDVLGVPPDDRGWLGEALAVVNRGFARQRDSDRIAVQAANDAAGQPSSAGHQLGQHNDNSEPSARSPSYPGPPTQIGGDAPLLGVVRWATHCGGGARIVS